MTFYLIFKKYLKKTEVVVGYLRVLSVVVNLASKCNYLFALSFPKFYGFQKNLNKKLCKMCNYEPCNWMLSEYCQRLRILVSNNTAQFLVVNGIRRFIWLTRTKNIFLGKLKFEVSRNSHFSML